MRALVAFLLVSVVAIAGCTSQTADKLGSGTDATMNDTMAKSGGAPPTTVSSSGESMKKEASGYSGAILAGSSAPLIDFNKPDYDAALKTGKPILLYFYATWCPICRAELPHLYGAFNELSTDRIIGFRVNFNDGDTDNDEINMAREFGVAYQHGKVIVKNGKSVLKSIETWDKSRYLDEINKVLLG